MAFAQIGRQRKWKLVVQVYNAFRLQMNKVLALLARDESFSPEITY